MDDLAAHYHYDGFLLATQVKGDTGNDTDVVLTIVYGVGDSSVDPVDFTES